MARRMRITILDGRHLVGRFMAFDRHMNIVLGDAEEFRRLPPKKGVPEADREIRRPLGLVLIRGEEVISMTVEGPPPTDDRRGKRDVAPVRPSELQPGCTARLLSRTNPAFAHTAHNVCRSLAAATWPVALGKGATRGQVGFRVREKGCTSWLCSDAPLCTVTSRRGRAAAKRLAAAFLRPLLARCLQGSLALCAVSAGLELQLCARRCAKPARSCPAAMPKAAHASFRGIAQRLLVQLLCSISTALPVLQSDGCCLAQISAPPQMGGPGMPPGMRPPMGMPPPQFMPPPGSACTRCCGSSARADAYANRRSAPPWLPTRHASAGVRSRKCAP